jgi:hypothetical protein
MTEKKTEREIIAYAYSDEHQLKTAPVQGYEGGIPWPLHLEAYEVYCKRHGRQTAMIDLDGRGCRGGFGTRELDSFIPGWRDRVTFFGRMNTQNKTLIEDNAKLRKALEEVAVAMKVNRQFLATSAKMPHLGLWDEGIEEINAILKQTDRSTEKAHAI